MKIQDCSLFLTCLLIKDQTCQKPGFTEWDIKGGGKIYSIVIITLEGKLARTDQMLPVKELYLAWIICLNKNVQWLYGLRKLSELLHDVAISFSWREGNRQKFGHVGCRKFMKILLPPEDFYTGRIKLYLGILLLHLSLSVQ